MFDVRRGSELFTSDGNGYVETDPSGRYGRFDDVLGKGATKTVYRAFDEVNGTEVAWNQAKLCDVMRNPEALERMYSEVHLLSSLKHDSIIRFHSSWIDVDNRTFNFITELFTSGTLHEYRRRYRQVDIKAIKNWARQILSGLVYLHSHDPPVIHRDLKCDNIFVNGHLGQVKIGDLGLAAVLRDSRCAHSVIGTPEFMAPELYEEEYNELVDIYSFGMCMVEMLTSEYPYCECENPAQIYKKVTSGKLPGAFHQIQDPDTKRFVGRCLENVSKRPTAQELLLDSFLAANDYCSPLPALRTSPNSGYKAKDRKSRSSDNLYLSEVSETKPNLRNRDMRITGKMNDDDDAIILKVQITDKKGKLQNIYFPFDIVSDTPVDVANEMVKELEITDLEPSEIADMIAQEISLLLPNWHHEGGNYSSHHVYNYDDDDEDGNRHPFCYLSSPTSSQGSVFGMVHSQSQSSFCNQKYSHQDDWFQDGQLTDDETSSMHSGVYSAMNFISGNTDEAILHSSREVPKQTETGSSSSHKHTRFGPTEDTTQLLHSSLSNKFTKQCKIDQPEFMHSPRNHRGGKQPIDNRRLTRNKSMVDVRSQLLHKTLVEQLKKKLFKTVGDVESIGFQAPCEGTSNKTKQKKHGHADRKRR